MQRRLATIGLTEESSQKQQLTVGVLSLPVKGARQSGSEQITGKQDSYKTRDTSSKSELVMPPAELYQVTRFETMSDGHYNRHMNSPPMPSGSI